MPRVDSSPLSFALSLALTGVLSAGVAACGGDDPAPSADANTFVDFDEDGFPAGEGEGFDCDDTDRFMNPDAPEACDNLDNDCDGTIDEDFDVDGDFWSTCEGDCRDNDATSYPGATELVDGYDNDCDGIADNNTSAYDDDGDGYSDDQGDCNDDPDQGGTLISPGAVEVQLNEDGEPEGVDNDCDGVVDEALAPCPTGGDRDDPFAYAAAIDACDFVTQAAFDPTLPIDPRSRIILPSYGVITPRSGGEFALLSTGIAGDTGSLSTNLGSQFQVPHPDPLPATGGCTLPDGSTVNDYTEVQLHILVPSNANGFSFDFNFMSIEFPEFVCTSFDDTFLAILESQEFTGNVSFDAMGNRVSINVGFFNICQIGLDPACIGDEELEGTGFGGTAGGGTGWLTTTAPVKPGEKIKITFMIFDEGDHILDSAVILDNFRWVIEEVDGPVTVPRQVPLSPGDLLLSGPAPTAQSTAP